MRAFGQGGQPARPLPPSLMPSVDFGLNPAWKTHADGWSNDPKGHLAGPYSNPVGAAVDPVGQNTNLAAVVSGTLIDLD